MNYPGRTGWRARAHDWWVESTLRELLKGFLPDGWFDKGPL